MITIKLLKISRLSTFSALLVTFLLFQGCKSSESLDQTDSSILGSTTSGEWIVNLRDGRTVKTSEYILDAKASKVIQGLIDNELKDYVSLTS